MLTAALAVAAGSWIGLCAPAPWLGAAFGLCAGVLAGWIGRGEPRRGKGAAGAIGWLALLGCAAAWRAGAGEHGAGAGTASDLVRARGPAEGVIEVRRLGGAAMRAWLAGVELWGEGWLARDGETVRLLPAEPAVPRPRAPPPVHAPRGSAGLEAVDAAPLELLPDQVVRRSPAARTADRPWLESVRRRWLERLRALPCPAAAELAPAVVLGDVSGVSDEHDDLFVRTGTRHLLAVSGSNVSQLALLASLPMWVAVRVTGLRLAWAGPLTALLVLLYIPLAGGEAPVQRAAIAFALSSLAALLPGRGSLRGRRVDPLSLLGCALLLEALADPRGLAALGLQLSYAATLGLILLSRRCARGIGALLGLDRTWAPASAGSPPPWPALLLARAGRAAALALGASLSASLATLPLAWSAFGEWSPAGVVLTPLVLPLVAALLLAAVAHTLAPALVPPGAVALPAELLLRALELADALPGTPAPLPWRPDWALAGAGLATLAWGASRAWGRAAALAWALVAIPWRAAPAELELAALEVGHGTAVALRGPGLGTWVFDAGSRDRRGVARSALGPWLAHWETAELGVCLSHADRDHASELEWLIERHPPRRWVGALPEDLRERLPHTALCLDVPRGELELGLSGPISARLLRGLADGGNEGSRALELRFPGGGALLLGDAEGEGLAALVRGGSLAGPLDVLLAAHHGSESPWLGPLLARVRPREVWVSASEPPAIGAELARRGVPFRSTCADGPLTARLRPRPEPPAGADPRLARSSQLPLRVRTADAPPGAGHMDPGGSGAAGAARPGSAHP